MYLSNMNLSCQFRDFLDILICPKVTMVGYMKLFVEELVFIPCVQTKARVNARGPVPGLQPGLCPLSPGPVPGLQPRPCPYTTGPVPGLQPQRKLNYKSKLKRKKLNYVLYLKKETQLYKYIHIDNPTLTLHNIRKITLRSDYRVLNG